jgi:hypothetical protein
VSRASGLFRRPILFDAGPLQTIFLIHYLERTAQLNTSYARTLIRESRPQLLDTGMHIINDILAGAIGRAYTQSGLTEALRFRDNSALKREEQLIRNLAIDAVHSFGLVEVSPSATYLREKKLISIVGLCDAIHVHLLGQDAELILLTDDGKLRQHAGVNADRIVVLNEFLAQDADLT